jgi:excisionase family DNA binding protein
MIDEKFYTPKQIAEILQVHQYTVLKWIREGKIRALKFGRVYRTTESELKTFLGQTAHNSAQEITRQNIAPEVPSVKFTPPPPIPQEHEETYSLNIGT